MPVKPPSDSTGERRGTSYDVARLAGVSQSAVSRCFREGGSVSPATRKRIMAAAEALGYRPNAIAQGLITRRSNMVAVVISNLTNLHYPEVLAELTTRLSNRGIRVLLFTLQNESEIDAVMDQIWRYQVDGAIVAARLSRDQAEVFARSRIPLVLYNRQMEEAPVSSVMCESGAGEAMLVDGMIAAGARAFGLIAGPGDSTVGEARVRAAVERLAQAGLRDVPVDRGDFSYQSGYDAALRLMKAAPLDAIIAANDVMAIGAMDAVRIECSLAVPDRVSVVGFDGVAPARWASYRLTTVRQPVGRMTEAAVSMLMDRIEDASIGPERRLFSGDLLRGASARLA
ncbi:LacI family DNA-binding transcriptional regulator [Sphingobium algorifonticola]|nr:LacI family DNA-binding transcriptional regulator [Sphingobium algorifonticola]